MIYSFALKPEVHQPTGTLNFSKIDTSNFVFTFINTSPDGVNNLTVIPNSSDGILYLGSLTDNKDVINTQGTSKVGDYVTIASLNSTAHWTVVDAQGVWAKES